MRKASFRVRKIYFDKIVSGEKTEEIRSYTPFWYDRLIANGPPEEAVFVCGSAVHRRRIKRVFIDVPEKILGRDLSPQGLRDVTTDSAIIVELGEEVKGGENRNKRSCPKCASRGVVRVGWAATVIERQNSIVPILTTVPVFECHRCGHKWEEVKA